LSDKTALYRQLAYLAENFDFNQPEDRWARDEYRQITKLLGIPEANRKNRKRVAEERKKK